MVEVNYQENQMQAFWQKKNFRESARLHLQHWLFQSTLGYLIHPSIANSLPQQNLRIADLACGNGAWLIEISERYPNAQLYGFDIAPVHFPPQTTLQSNIKLAQQDVLAGPWSDDLVGSFDFVHIRAFSSLIKNNDTSVILGAIRGLLKPGGYLQWDEMDPGSMTATAGEGGSVQMSRMLLAIIEQGGKRTGTLFDWLSDFEPHLTKAKFTDVKVDVGEVKPQHLKAWTEDHLLVYEEVASLLPSEKDAPETPLSREKYLGLFAGVVKETEAGTVIHPQRVVVSTAKKV